MYRDIPWFTFTSVGGERWLLLAHPWPPIVFVGSCLVYLLLVFAVWPATRPTAAKSVRQWTAIHKSNCIALFSYSLFTAIFSTIWLGSTGQLFVSGWMERHFCNPPPEWWWYWLGLPFLFSKIWEWSDTMFIVYLKGMDDLNFLHVFHHATTFPLYILEYNAPFGKFAVWVNACIHTIMYAHFAWRLPKKFRPVITILQIVQLIFGLYFWIWEFIGCERYVGFITQYPLEFWVGQIPTAIYIIYFMRFFVKNYISRSRNQKELTDPASPLERR